MRSDRAQFRDVDDRVVTQIHLCDLHVVFTSAGQRVDDPRARRAAAETGEDRRLPDARVAHRDLERRTRRVQRVVAVQRAYELHVFDRHVRSGEPIAHERHELRFLLRRR
jgi:hypothetical protein